MFTIDWKGIWSQIIWPAVEALCSAAKFIAVIGAVAALIMIAKDFMESTQKEQDKYDVLKKVAIIVMLFFILWNLKTVLNFIGISSGSF